MEPVYREFTVKEALDALYADAIPWTQGALHKDIDEQGYRIVGSACAIGIMAVNLGVNEGYLEQALRAITIMVEGDSYTLGSKIIALNDSRSLGDVIKFTKTLSEKQLNTPLKVQSKSYLSKIQK